MPVATEKLIRMKANTFRATLRLGLPFRGPIHVPEDLKIRDTAITHLCDALCVDGKLDLDGCVNLTSLPSRLIVRGELVLDGCVGITALPATLREVFGLKADGCEALASIDPIVECRGPLDLTGCKAMAPLPPTFRAVGMASMNGCVFYPNLVQLVHTLPQTILAAAPGRRLGELLHHTVLAGHPILDAIIEDTAFNRFRGASVLQLDATALVVDPT